jgi:hypothetical protein
MAKHIHVHVHDSAWTYNGTYDPKDDEKWKRIWSKLRPINVIRDEKPKSEDCTCGGKK